MLHKSKSLAQRESCCWPLLDYQSLYFSGKCIEPHFLGQKFIFLFLSACADPRPLCQEPPCVPKRVICIDVVSTDCPPAAGCPYIICCLELIYFFLVYEFDLPGSLGTPAQ